VNARYIGDSSATKEVERFAGVRVRVRVVGLGATGSGEGEAYILETIFTDTFAANEARRERTNSCQLQQTSSRQNSSDT